MQKINKNDIKWIKQGDEQSSDSLNRPIKGILNELGNTQTSSIEKQLIDKNGNQDSQRLVSQKAVTEELNGLYQRLFELNEELKKYVNHGINNTEAMNNAQNSLKFLQGGAITQSAGTSTIDVMSQQQINYLINTIYGEIKTLLNGNGITFTNVNANTKRVSLANTKQDTNSTNIIINSNNTIDAKDTLIGSTNTISNDNNKLNLRFNNSHFKLSGKTLVLNKVEFSNTSLTVKEAYGLGVDGQAWQHGTTQELSGKNDKNYQKAFFVKNQGNNCEIKVDGKVILKSIQGSWFFIVPPNTSYSISNQSEFYVLRLSTG